jgi:hypothetical protein
MIPLSQDALALNAWLSAAASNMGARRGAVYAYNPPRNTANITILV